MQLTIVGISEQGTIVEMNWSEPLGEITAKKSIKWLQTRG